MHKNFLPYAHQSIDASDIEAVSHALTQNLITRGPLVEEFEKAIADYCGAEHAIAFNNATSALYGAYYGAGMGPSDRVITTPNTFIATVGAAIYLGATPVFVDIDPETGNLDLEQAEANLQFKSSRGKLFFAPVHFAGIAIDMKKFYLSSLRQDVVSIEDAAHALGSYYPSGERVGCCQWSDLAVFSFHPAKHITTAEGGMVVTNNEEMARRVRLFRNNGMERDARYLERGAAAPWYYEVQEISGNFNFSDIQAALGLSQLKRLDRFIEKRRKLVKRYREALENAPHIKLMTTAQDDYTAYHLFVVQIDFKAIDTTRTQLMEQLKEQGIGSQLHYIPIYDHPALIKKFGEINTYFPKMEEYYSKALSLPLYYDLSEEDVDYICAELIKILKH